MCVLCGWFGAAPVYLQNGFAIIVHIHFDVRGIWAGKEFRRG